jgi:hypothetical protein
MTKLQARSRIVAVTTVSNGFVVLQMPPVWRTRTM